LKVLRQEGVWLEVTNLVIPGWTDDPDMIRRMCEWLVANGLRDVPLHFSRFTPLYKLSQLPVTPVAVLEQACATARKAGVRYVYLGNVPGHPAENTACPRCGKTVIERRGFAILRRSMKNGACAYCGEAIAGVWGTPS
jgi:pyruvate formate lyase activating enzyme